MKLPPPRDRALDGLRRLIEHPRLPHIALAGSMLLTAPSLLAPLALDDFVLGLLSRGGGGITGFEGRHPLSLFTFTTGDPVSNRALMAEGALLPWWTDPAHLNAFFRPLSSLTHRLDFSLFPASPFLMHLHSLAWFFAALLAAQGVYRSVHAGGLNQRRLAGLALLLFAWDDPHGATLGWVSNRNALVAAALALPALVGHRRLVAAMAHRSPDVATRAVTSFNFWVGPACFAAGLSASEFAVGVLGYLLAHALCLEQDRLVLRLARLLPYAIVLAAWRGIYRVLDLGSRGSGAYHDPLREPLAFMAAAARNIPILLGAQHGPPYADLAFWAPPEHWPALLLLSLTLLTAVVALAWPVLRDQAPARFYALGSLLAAIPVSASLPGERLLLLVGIGGSGLAALIIDHYRARARGARLARGVLFGFVGLHMVAAPLALPIWSLSMGLVGHAVRSAEQRLPRTPSVADQTFILVNAPFDIMASFIQPARAYRGTPRPRHLHWLATASSPITVSRTGRRKLLVTSERGLLHSPQQRHYRRDPSGLSAGARVELPAMTAKVLASDPRGGPTRVEFTFKVALASPELSLFVWRDGRFAPFVPPPPGQSVRLPAQDFFQTVLRSTWTRIAD